MLMKVQVKYQFPVITGDIADHVYCIFAAKPSALVTRKV
jgi:hypothetical protein